MPDADKLRIALGEDRANKLKKIKELRGISVESHRFAFCTICEAQTCATKVLCSAMCRISNGRFDFLPIKWQIQK